MTIKGYINIRTMIAFALSLVSCFISIHYELKLDLDLVLFGLAIGFPLATSIQTAFKRRDRALEYLGLFKAGMLSIHYGFQTSKKLDASKKGEAAITLATSADRLYHHLQTSRGETFFDIGTETDRIIAFVEQNREYISTRTLSRTIRYIKDVLDGATYLVSLTRHRTIKGLRIYSLIFVNLFIILNAPILHYNLDGVLPIWGVYLFSGAGALILITLYNFQSLIEYPFDQKGVDDIKLEDYKLNISPSAG